MLCDTFQDSLLQKIDDQGNLVARPEFTKRYQSEDGHHTSYNIEKIVGLESVMTCHDKILAAVYISFEIPSDFSDEMRSALHERAFALGKAALCVIENKNCERVFDQANSEALTALVKSVNRGDPNPLESAEYGIVDGKILNADDSKADQYINKITGIEVDFQPELTTLSIFTPANWN